MKAFAMMLVVAMSAMWPVAEPSAATANRSERVSGAYEFLKIAIPLTSRWEGIRLRAYRDIVGVWTVCFGETNGVTASSSYTREECESMLQAQLLDYRKRLHGYFTADTLATRLPATRDAAFTDLAYNAGVYAIGRSTAVRRLNEGRVVAACEALTWWNKAGGRVVRGLVARRTENKALCLIRDYAP